MLTSLQLTTPRLTLVAVTVEHASVLFPLMSNPRVTTYLAWSPHTCIGDTLDVLTALVAEQSRGAGYHWAIFEGGEARGLISLIDIRRKHRLWTLDRAELAYWIDPERHGLGLATEATQAVITCAFTTLGLNKLRISHTSSNPASGRIPQKLGFRFIGTEYQYFMKNGVWYDMNHYELLAADRAALPVDPR